jgi:hypothetical protein
MNLVWITSHDTRGLHVNQAQFEWKETILCSEAHKLWIAIVIGLDYLYNIGWYVVDVDVLL